MIRADAAFVLLVTAGVSGCRVGPRHEAPELELPSRFVESTATTEVASDARWWRSFGDATLDGLVERAIQGNVDLTIARERVLEARAVRDASVGPTRPSLDARAGISRNGPSDSGAFQRGGDYSLFEAGFDASWEIDVFGRLAARVDAAEAAVGSATEARQDALVSLCAEVAREYVVLRETQEQLAIRRTNLATQVDTLQLTRARATAGFSPELDVARSEVLVETTSASIPSFESRARASIHRLGVLVGGLPGDLVDLLETPLAIPSAPALVAAGLPMDVVRRRPDVRRAERDLARETALTAEATADLYPRLSLSASFGQEARTASDLFDAASNAWSIGGGLLAPLFRGGELRANLRAQESRRAQAALAWKGTVLSALREVEDGLVSVVREREREARLQAATTSSRRALELARDLNAQGIVDFFDVLDSQRAVLTSESDLVASRASVARETVALYKALGGAPDSGDEVLAATP